MQKISTMRTSGKRTFKGPLTIGVDLAGRSSCYCVLDKNGEIILEQKVATTPEAVSKRQEVWQEKHASERIRKDKPDPLRHCEIFESHRDTMNVANSLIVQQIACPTWHVLVFN